MCYSDSSLDRKSENVFSEIRLSLYSDSTKEGPLLLASWTSDPVLKGSLLARPNIPSTCFGNSLFADLIRKNSKLSAHVDWLRQTESSHSVPSTEIEL